MVSARGNTLAAPGDEGIKVTRAAWLAWGCGGVFLILASGALVACSGAFAKPNPATGMPILGFAASFLLVSVVFLASRHFIPVRRGSPAPEARRELLFVFSAGLLARGLLLASEPILEVDFNRYIWDGGLTANGFSPYAVAPAKISALAYNDPRLELSKAAGSVFEGISYSEFKTVYPPVAQAAFAVAHLIGPWSLTAWRLVCLAGEIATFTLLVVLLRDVARNPLLVTLYWWNPLVLKELANSAHMEAILIPLVLSAFFLALRGRPLWATIALCAAAGAKIWPVLLLPLFLRALTDKPKTFTAALAITGIALAGLALPVWLGGLDRSSGFVGFATQWSTNSALFPVLRASAEGLLDLLPAKVMAPELLARGVAGVAVLIVALGLAWRPARDDRDLVRRGYLTVSALVLFSPAQFPWYILWVLPLAILTPGRGWFVAAATMPIYYASFYFLARGSYHGAEPWICGLIWLPVWLTLLWDWRRANQS